MYKKIFKFAVIIILIATMVVILFEWCDSEMYKAEHPQDAVTHGIVTIYDKDENVHYQYAGDMEMNIQDDEGEVIVVLPEIGCSCFEKDGE